MKRWLRKCCSTFCILSFFLPGGAIAVSEDELTESLEERPGQVTAGDESREVLFLSLLSGDFNLEPVSMVAGKPVGALLLFVSHPDGKLIKDAQVVATLIDARGNQSASRAMPHKCGYLVTVDQLAAGEYLVEAEVITGGQLLTDSFKFSKA